MATAELKFSVQTTTKPGEIVCMVGNCSLLGDWDPQKGKVLSLEKTLTSGVELWSVILRLSPHARVDYRYFIAHVHESEGDGEDKSIMVRQWEVNMQPRIFACQQFFANPEKYTPENAVFGTYGGQTNIDKGWLTSQTEIHVRLYGNPVHMWKARYNLQSYRIKCTTLDLRDRDTEIGYDEEDSNHELQAGGAETHPYVSILDGEHEDSVLQPQCGSLYRENDYMIFKVQTHEPEYLGYQFDFYVANPSLGDEQDLNPKHVGYAFLLPVNIKQTIRRKVIPITGMKHKPIGQLSVEWLIIQPLKVFDCSMERSFARYFKRQRQALDVGHRGMGSSYNQPERRECEAARENTIRSLSDAAKHGADYVEFDVQLSRDRVPVVYHDFTVNLTLKKKQSEELDWLEIAVRDLNLSQLQMLKLDHVSTKTKGSPLTVSSSTVDLTANEDQPFPTLKDVFQHVDHHLGFAIELKYPVEMKDGSYEEGIIHYFDKNVYCDIMCHDLLKYAGQRRVKLFCFDPDVCTMMRLKQNLYPVFMLTQGQTERYDWYGDERTWCTRSAYSVARSELFLGVGVHSEEILRNTSLIQEGQNKGLVLFGWGQEFDHQENVQLCKKLGMEGIIYDKVSEFTHGKENIFKLERDTQDVLYQAIHTEEMPDIALTNPSSHDLHLDELQLEQESATAPQTRRMSFAPRSHRHSLINHINVNLPISEASSSSLSQKELKSRRHTIAERSPPPKRNEPNNSQS